MWNNDLEHINSIFTVNILLLFVSNVLFHCRNKEDHEDWRHKLYPSELEWFLNLREFTYERNVCMWDYVCLELAM